MGRNDKKILGMIWKPEEDVFIFKVCINFPQKRCGVRIGPNVNKI